MTVSRNSEKNQHQTMIPLTEVPTTTPLMKTRDDSMKSFIALLTSPKSGKQDQEPLKFIIVWLKICSYTAPKCYKLFLLLLMTSALVVEYLSIGVQNWYVHIVQISWIISSYIIFYTLHRNIKTLNYFTNDINRNEFHTCTLCYLLLIIMMRFVPSSMESVCEKITSLDIIANIGAFIVNSMTMYSLDFVILYFSLKIVKKHDTLIKRIENEKNLHIEEIKIDFDAIQENVTSFKQKWQFVVSLSCMYHLICASVYGFVWITNISNEFWAYCSNNDEYTSVILVLIRFCVRTFALLYGILRINHKPKKLAKVINDCCNWKDQEQQFQIQRIVKSLTEFHDKFKVIVIGIEWKHFAGLIISTVAVIVGTIVRAKFG